MPRKPIVLLASGFRNEPVIVAVFAKQNQGTEVRIVVAILLFVTLTMSACGYYFYKLVYEFPEESEIENLRARYPELIVDLDRAVELSESTLSLAAKLEAITYPADTLSVSLRNNSDDELNIINRFAPSNKGDAKNSMRAMVNHSGYGRKNNQHYFILQHSLKQHDYKYDHIEVLIERITPAPERTD